MIKTRNAILGLLFYEFLRTILSPHTFARDPHVRNTAAVGPKEGSY